MECLIIQFDFGIHATYLFIICFSIQKKNQQNHI